MKIRLTAVSCFVYIIGMSSQVMSADYYVSQTGSDSNSGLQSAPFRTISRAYSLVKAGDRILVQPGTYTDYQSGWALVLNKSGTAAAPITLKSVQRGMAIINASNQSNRPYGLAIEGSYQVIDGFKITGSKYTAVFINGSNNKFINNEVYNNGKVYDAGHTGNQAFYSRQNTSGNYYGQNYIHDNGGAYEGYDHGLYLCGKNETVVNNIVVRQPAMGLQIGGYSTVSNLKVYNNIFAYNGRRGIVLWLALNNIQIYNNIIVWNGTDGIGSVDASGSGVTISNNVIYGNATNLRLSGFNYTLGTAIQKDPLFVSSTDYHLKSTSPAINAGKSLIEVSQDYAGNLRPATGVDIGVYEGGGSTPPAQPAPSSSSATFVKLDTATRGSWSGVYGADGYIVSQDSNTKIPNYAQVSFSGALNYIWNNSPIDTRALQRPENKSSRISATWYANTYSISAKLTDGNPHQVALYLLDWDGSARAETITVTDAATGAVLDTRAFPVGSFHNGQYAVWTVKGNVKFQVARTSGANAVVSGIFFR